MDLILNIFKQLGADSTFFIQFSIFIVAFLLLKFLLFDKLMFVIEHRENNTTKLLKVAEKNLEEAEKVAEQYKTKIDETQAEAQGELLEKKVVVIEKQREEIKKVELRLTAEIMEEKEVFAKRAQEYQSELFNSSKEITDKLVQKLTD